MIVKIHSTGGHSFAGLVEYLAKEEGRLSWTETRNLLTGDPMKAARVMAATAMNQASLKRDAGISNAGRKPGGAVMHLSISWKDEESKSRRLTPEQMSEVANIVLQNLGATKKQRAQYANEHQVVIVAHNDKSHDHLHIVVNRVHPEHGVYLPTNNDYLKMSAWALTYEKEGGRIYCPNREINWKLRDQKQYVRGAAQTRTIWNLRKQAVNSNDPQIDDTIAESKKQDRSIYAQKRALKAKHSQEWKELSDSYQSKIASIDAGSKRERSEAISGVQASFRSRWKERLNNKERAVRDFLKNENGLLGRIKNVMQCIDFDEIRSPKERGQALRSALNSMTNQSARMKSFTRQQNKLDASITREQNQSENCAVQSIEADRKHSLAKNRDWFLGQRSKLIQSQKREKKTFDGQWRERNRKRNGVIGSLTRRLSQMRDDMLSSLRRKVDALDHRKHSADTTMKKQDIGEASPSNPEVQKILEKARLLEEFNRNASKSKSQSPRLGR